MAAHFFSRPKAEVKPYVYQEYPKWIITAAGHQKIVNDAEEEARETAPLDGVIYDEFGPACPAAKLPPRKARK